MSFVGDRTAGLNVHSSSSRSSCIMRVKGLLTLSYLSISIKARFHTAGLNAHASSSRSSCIVHEP